MIEKENHYTDLWFTTSLLGSVLFATIIAVCNCVGNPGAAILLFFVVFIISFLCSTIASAPVFIFSLAIPADRTPRSAWKRIRNFQIALYILFQTGLLHMYSYRPDRQFWFLSGMLLAYLIIGFIVWKRGILQIRIENEVSSPAVDKTGI
jgi:surface polysaccharide O-acyltransferase-like enzyme